MHLSPRSISRLPFALALALAGGFASAQSLYTQKLGTLQGETLGAAYAPLDDLDGDGVRDFAVSAPS